VDLTGRDDLSATLQNVEVPVTAILGGVELSVDELASLKPGDVIRFAERADHPVRLSVMNQAMAWAVPGKVGDRVALRLLTPLQHLMEA
jgi:flagellar motor switch protein FliM